MSEAAFWVRMPLPFWLNHVNIYLIEDGDGWAVLDAGIGNDTTRAIWEASTALISASDWISCMAVAGLAMGLDCTPAQAASANEMLPACKLYLSVVDKHGAASQSELPHLMDAGECF